MEKFTYETEDIKTPLEKMEWDNVWWDHAGDMSYKRVL